MNRQSIASPHLAMRIKTSTLICFKPTYTA